MKDHKLCPWCKIQTPLDCVVIDYKWWAVACEKCGCTGPTILGDDYLLEEICDEGESARERAAFLAWDNR